MPLADKAEISTEISGSPNDFYTSFYSVYAATIKGINHQWTESPGYRHDYQIWRIYLKDFAVQLFKK